MKHAFVWACLVAASCSGPREERSTFAGVVASASPEASEAGRRILESGGNAVDAAIAVSFALGVSEPAMSGLGGQTQILLFSPETGGVVVNGTSHAPAGTPPDAVHGDLVGRRATTVPTTVKVLDYAYRRYGSGRLTWRELIEPAIGYADTGVVLGSFREKVYRRHAAELNEDEATGALFQSSGAEPLRQPLLAATLERIAAEGADAFYHGAIAREIASDMEQNGGWLSFDDLDQLAEPEEIEPLATDYRGYRVLTLPPPGGGWVVLQMLEMLETFEPASLQPGDSRRVEHLARVLERGHRERRERPVSDLRDYRGDIDQRLSSDAIEALLHDSRGETTHFSIVDANGMAVSVTASINAYYGARVAHPSLGFLYNDYMHEYEIGRREHPFRLRAGAMPYSSMSPTVLVRDGEPRLVLGSPGSDRIISAVTQVVQLWVDGGLPLEDAVSFPRFHARAGGELFAEAPRRFQSELEQLRDSGFALREATTDLAGDDGNPFFGGVHAVARENGAWVGAADPRRDGTAVIVAPVVSVP